MFTLQKIVACRPQEKNVPRFFKDNSLNVTKLQKEMRIWKDLLKNSKVWYDDLR